MVALNGAQLNGSALNGVHVNGPWVAPTTLPQCASGPLGTEIGWADDPRHDAVHDQPTPPTVAPLPDQTLDDLDAERARLEAEIAAANARTAAAKDRAAARDAEVSAALHAELVASREELAEIERQHEVALAMVRTAAQAEVERILAVAHHPSAGHIRGIASDGAGANDAD